jgi:trichothecene 3-O-acetyltransferase
MALREIRVRPLGWEAMSPRQDFALSEMDHLMPKMYVLISEIFECPRTLDREHIVTSLTRGLETALVSYPILAGVLDMQPATGQLSVSKSRDSDVALHVKYLDGDGDFPTFAALEQSGFPVHLIDGNKLLPNTITQKPLFVPESPQDGHGSQVVVSTFQISFISGGVIISSAVHHNVSDGPGCDAFLRTWAAASAAAMKGHARSPVLPITHVQPPLVTENKPDADRMRVLGSQHPVLKNPTGPPSAPPPGFVMPELQTVIWHFPASRADLLQAECSTAKVDVSRNNAILALLWKTITRAKIPLLYPSLDKPVTFVHAITTQDSPSGSLGTHAAMLRTGPIPIEDLIASNNLARVAAMIQSSVDNVSPSFIAEQKEWIRGVDDKRHITVDVDSFLGMDLAGTNWEDSRGLKCYETHDFGFGLPRAMRWPHPRFEGYVALWPNRKAVSKEEDEGVEVCVCLERGSHERLWADGELLKYGRPRMGQMQA